jgi:hypothetical protein
MKQHENNVIILKIIRYTLLGLFILFLIINLISSQTISPLFFKFVNNDKQSTIAFLQKIKTLPEYSRILEMNNNIYGPTIKAEIFKQENAKKTLINNLEQQLTINPKARDVLYSLYLLTKDDKYLKQVRKIDPDFN